MRYQPLSKITDAYWYSFNDEPIATRGALKLCDPAYLLPEESPDGLWHMFAHTWIGLEHFTSTSGLEWRREHLVTWRAHSPFIFREGGTYWLFYEIHDRTTFSSKSEDSISASRIMVISSNDLMLWSKPKLVLDSTKIKRAQYKDGPVRVSRPQLIEWEGRYRLYFGAGETRMYDTRQKTTARLMYAESDYLDKEWRVNPEPLLEIEPDSEYRNLAVDLYASFHAPTGWQPLNALIPTTGKRTGPSPVSFSLPPWMERSGRRRRSYRRRRKKGGQVDI